MFEVEEIPAIGLDAGKIDMRAGRVSLPILSRSVLSGASRILLEEIFKGENLEG